MSGHRLAWRAAVAVMAVLGLVVSLASCAPDAPGADGVVAVSASKEPGAPEPTGTLTASPLGVRSGTPTARVTPERSPAASEAPQEVNRMVEQSEADPRPQGTEADQSTYGQVCGGFNYEFIGEPPNKRVLQWWPGEPAILFDDGRLNMYVVAADGSQVRRIIDAPIDKYAKFERKMDGNVSPDGTQIVFTRCRYFEKKSAFAAIDKTYEILIWNPEAKTTRRLAFGVVPVWSPDGTRIAFIGHPTEKELAHLYTMTPDGADWWRLATATRVGRPPQGAPDDGWRQSTVVRVARPPQWAPDGRRLAFVQDMAFVQKERDPRDGRYAIYTIAADGADPLRLTPTVSDPAWSPDGGRIAFAKPEADTVSLYTIAVDGTDAQRVRAMPLNHWRPRRGPAEPTGAWIESVAWSPDGSKILYSCDGICVVDLDDAPAQRILAAGEGSSAVDDVDRLPSPNAPSGLVLPSLPGDVAAWSPDGSRIVTISTERPDPNRHHNPVLRTVAPDGSVVRILVVQDKEGSLQSAGDLRQAEIAACGAGTAVPKPEANPDLVRDCETLLRVRDALRGTAELNWTSNRPLDEWDGVVVDGWPRRLMAISLNGRGLTGEIPPELGGLTHLRRLSLHGNRLGGAIPPELGQLTQLARLELSDNSLTGGIPRELDALTRLVALHLSNNQLTGPIPQEVGQLTNLELLFLGGNGLTGCIPPALMTGPRNDLSTLGLPECE